MEKNFIERSNFKAGLARRRPINRKLGQEEQAQVVKQTQIGSKWSHIVSQKSGNAENENTVYVHDLCEK